MPRYYAYCETHGRVGPDRNSCREAAPDGTAHLAKDPTHAIVYCRETTIKLVNGKKQYRYKKIMEFTL